MCTHRVGPWLDKITLIGAVLSSRALGHMKEKLDVSSDERYLTSWSPKPNTDTHSHQPQSAFSLIPVVHKNAITKSPKE